MRILAFSDVRKWRGYERLVDRCRPDVVALAGDLTSDGVAAFWDEALEFLPQFRQEREDLRQRCKRDERRGRGCSICGGPVFPYEGCGLRLHTDFAFFDHLRQLSNHCRKTEAFAQVQRKIHTDRFYRFLEYAGKRACVLVIKGDHDDDFPGVYDRGLINKILGCQEISGRTYEAGGQVFLGVSYQDTAYRRTSRGLLARFQHRGGVVICHARQRNVRLVADLKPRLIIRGHFGVGKYLVERVPAVFTAGAHAIIEIRGTGLPRIQQRLPRTEEVQIFDPTTGRYTTRRASVSIGSEERKRLRESERERYTWLQPYNRGD